MWEVPFVKLHTRMGSMANFNYAFFPRRNSKYPKSTSANIMSQLFLAFRAIHLVRYFIYHATPGLPFDSLRPQKPFRGDHNVSLVLQLPHHQYLCRLLCEKWSIS